MSMSSDDDARWEVTCRARECERADGILHDPFASLLAGAAQPSDEPEEGSEAEFGVVLRAAVIDELLLRTVIDEHIHTLVDLDAGFDTRPYRLELPSDLRWVELDRESLLAFKAIRLAHAVSSCRVERVGVDAPDAAARLPLLRQLCRGVARGLLLIDRCLDGQPPKALREFSGLLPTGLRWWILHTPLVRDGMDPLVETWAAKGWQVVDCKPLRDEALTRAPARVHQPVGDSSTSLDFGVVWLLTRSSGPRQRRPLPELTEPV